MIRTRDITVSRFHDQLRTAEKRFLFNIANGVSEFCQALGNRLGEPWLETD